MARGDLTVFNDALAYMIDGGFESADTIKCGLITNAVVPTATTSNPQFGTTFTEVTPGGNYSAGGISLGDLGTLISQAAGVMTCDSTTNPSWALNAGNPTNAYYAIVYNDTDGTNRCLAFVDLAGPINMQTVDLPITWNVAGLFTIAR